MATAQRVRPGPWFTDGAEEAARFYTGASENARIAAVTRYGTAGSEAHGRPAGSVMTGSVLTGSVLTVEFEFDGQPFTAPNGGPASAFNEAVSLQVVCRTQGEADSSWERLSGGGDPEAPRCGWLKDRYGLSWQVVPEGVEGVFEGGGSAGAQRAMEAVLRMKKRDLAELRRAYEGAG